jgi:Tfp pilus assembly protein PilP
MKSSKLILALWLSASAWAQTLPPQRPLNVPPAAKPTVASKPAPAPAVVYKSAVKPHARSTAQYQRKPASKGKAVQPPPALAGEAKPKSKTQRDPFVSPVVERIREVAACSGTGRQCLLVGDVNLRGVVRSPSGAIAVVVNGEHTYFLRENDPLADGAVERITNDAIILRERSSDAAGRAVTREVTKRLGAVPAV